MVLILLQTLGPCWGTVLAPIELLLACNFRIPLGDVDNECCGQIRIFVGRLDCRFALLQPLSSSGFSRLSHMPGSFAFLHGLVDLWLDHEPNELWLSH